MSAFSKPMCHREGNKIRVSIMLKVPIDLDLELLGMPPTSSSSVLDSPTGDSELEVEISGEGEADCYENVQALSNQLVAQLLQNRQIETTSPQTQHEQDNLPNQPEGSAKAERSMNTWSPSSEKAARQPVTAKEILEKTRQPLSNRPSDQLSVSPTSPDMVELTEEIRRVPLPTLGEGSSDFSEEGRTPPFEKKLTGHLLDSFNNGLTLAVNVVGTVLFLGKLANYTWE
ncbi:MAG: hypothetical protein PUP93_30070 [Rhizonema sp. NSF051]|nr:hypothetical protein [Rhizonema sp. NSF051]